MRTAPSRAIKPFPQRDSTPSALFEPRAISNNHTRITERNRTYILSLRADERAVKSPKMQIAFSSTDMERLMRNIISKTLRGWLSFAIHQLFALEADGMWFILVVAQCVTVGQMRLVHTLFELRTCLFALVIRPSQHSISRAWTSTSTDVASHHVAEG
jgi:hypothetical protein